ncbi:MAG: sortase [Anaerolineae bacterium]
MSLDGSSITNDSGATTSTVHSAVRRHLWRWLSTGLIVVGLLMLGAGGFMVYQSSTAALEPPPPVGKVDPLLLAGLEENPLPVAEAPSSMGSASEAAAPPGLEQNPLPVIAEDTLSTPSVVGVGPLAAPPSPATPLASGVAGETAGSGQEAANEAMRQAEGEVPSGQPSPAGSDSEPAETGPPTRIVAPAINLDAKVVPVSWKQVLQRGRLVSVWEVAAYAAGWHKNSALPGTGGNVVLSGHHNTKGEVFRYIIDLEPGDTVTLYVGERPYTYTVESRFVLRDKGRSEEKRRENARWIGPFPDERLTLVTCWPYTSNTHRVIIIARPEGQVQREE